MRLYLLASRPLTQIRRWLAAGARYSSLGASAKCRVVHQQQPSLSRVCKKYASGRSTAELCESARK